MITRRYEVDNLTGTEIKLGRVGEHCAICVEFDVRPWLVHYPDAFVMLYATLPTASRNYRPGMTQKPSVPEGYIVATTFADGIVSWIVQNTDTARDGQGAAELILYGQNGEVIQSTVVKTRISPSLSHGGNCGCAPSPMQPWVDQVAQLRMDTMEAAERAELAVEQIQGVTAEKLVVNKPTRYDFPSIGSADVIYKAEKELKLYQWNATELKYDPLCDSDTDDNIEIIHGGDADGTA